MDRESFGGPLGSVLSEFQTQLQEHGRTNDTVYRYGVAVREFGEVLGDRGASFGNILSEPSVVESYVYRLHQRGLAQSTIMGRLARLGTFLNWVGAHDDQWQGFAYVEPVDHVQRRPPWLDHSAALDFERAQLSTRLRAPLQIPEQDALSIGAGRISGSVVGMNIEQMSTKEFQDQVPVGTGPVETVAAEAAETEEVTPPDREPDSPPAPRGEAGEAARYLQARGPDRAEPRTRIEILARIAMDDDHRVSAILKSTVVPPEGSDMRLLISAPDFKTLSDQLVSVHVPQRGSSEWVPFVLESGPEGLHDIEIHALNGSTHLGTGSI